MVINFDHETSKHFFLYKKKEKQKNLDNINQEYVLWKYVHCCIVVI